jgi:prepilin-type N-terminal cleavage/methylation domain-containing protein
MRKGFTLIELLIVIAIVLIVLAGEATVVRRMIRSTHDAHDLEAASSILASELVELRNNGIEVAEGVLPLPIPPERLSRIPADASGEIRLSPHGENGLAQVEAILRWRGVIAPRELSMSTLVRVYQGAKK